MLCRSQKSDCKKTCINNLKIFYRLNMFDDDSSSEEDERQAFYAGGSQQSGQQVLGPSKKKKDIVSQLFKSARELVFVLFF